jgi:hypothetical protein
MRAEQKAADRRRGMVIVVICVVVGVLIVGLAAFKPIKDALSTHEYSNKALSEIGAPASACQKVTTKPATGNQEHVANGSPISYTDSPPVGGAEAATAGQTQQVGAWQYCSALSGAALQKLVIDYLYADSPEPTSP